jgi:hypothetical protein
MINNCQFWTFQKVSKIKLYIHEETLDIGSKVMVVVCIQTLYYMLNIHANILKTF